MIGRGFVGAVVLLPLIFAARQQGDETPSPAALIVGITQEGRVSVRDSAGIRIIQLARGYAQDLPHWSIAPSPDLKVGEVDGEAPYLLTSVAGASIGSDGTLAVADVMSSEVRFFDRKGRFLGLTGGNGQGRPDYG